MTSLLPRPRKYFPAGFVPHTREMNDSFSARENTIAATAARRWTLVRLSRLASGRGPRGVQLHCFLFCFFFSFALGGGEGGGEDQTSCKFVRTY